MFCPQCGVRPATDDLKFCPRCGLALAPVRGVIGVADERAGEGEGRREPSWRGAFRRGVKCLLWGAALTACGYLFGLAKLILDGRIPPHDGATRELFLPLGYLAVALLLFVGPGLILYGLVRALVAAGFERGARAADAGPTTVVDGVPRFGSAGERGARLASATAELVPVASVTERTTTLLPGGPGARA
jgi:hypothetical protein